MKKMLCVMLAAVIIVVGPMAPVNGADCFNEGYTIIRPFDFLPIEPVEF